MDNITYSSKSGGESIPKTAGSANNSRVDVPVDINLPPPTTPPSLIPAFTAPASTAAPPPSVYTAPATMNSASTTPAPTTQAGLYEYIAEALYSRSGDAFSGRRGVTTSAGLYPTADQLTPGPLAPHRFGARCNPATSAERQKQHDDTDNEEDVSSEDENEQEVNRGASEKAAKKAAEH